MKSLILLVCSLFAINCSYIPQATSEEMNHEFIINFPSKTKNQIYEKSMRWIILNYKSGRERYVREWIIESQDKEEGAIIGNGYLTNVGLGEVTITDLEFKIIIDCKDEKARFRLIPLYVFSLGNKYEFGKIPKLHKQAHKIFENLTDKISSFIKTDDDF